MKAKITLVVITLLVSLALQTNATEIKGLRHYSESSKTRIVIQLNNLAQYKTHKLMLILEHRISVSILDSRLDCLDRSFNIGDGLVKTVTLKEMEDSSVDVTISLERPTTFNVFSLDSPARIVIDVTPVDNVITPEVVAISPLESKSVPQTIVNKPTTATNKNTKPGGYVNARASSDSVPQTVVNKPTTATNKNTKPGGYVNAKASSDSAKQVVDNTNEVLSSAPGFGDVKSWFTNTNYVLIQLVFDILMLTALVYIGIKVKIVLNFARFIRKRGRALKGNKVFADMLIELEKGFSQEQEGKHENVSKSKSANVERKAKKSATEQISVPKQYDKVHEMAQRGMDPLSISQKSNIPIGEVTLILDLIKAKREGQTSS
jgi:hypothetical protein